MNLEMLTNSHLHVHVHLAVCPRFESYTVKPFIIETMTRIKKGMANTLTAVRFG